MPFNGSGVFTPAVTFLPDTLATASDQNAQDVDFAGGLTNCVTRDGQSPATASLSMGGFQLKLLANGTAPGDAVNLSQVSGYMPVGTVIDFAGSTAPANFLFCDGSAQSRLTYAALFAVIGSTYGDGDGSTTFNLPDCRGRVSAGLDNMGGSAANRLTSTTMTPDGDTRGATGGTQTVTLDTTQIPAHSHANTLTDPGHVHTYTKPENPIPGAQVGGANNFVEVVDSPVNTASAFTGISITNANTGGGGAHANIQPTILFNKCIRYQ